MGTSAFQGRRFAQKQKRPPEKRGGRYKGTAKNAGHGAPFLRQGERNGDAKWVPPGKVPDVTGWKHEPN